MLKKLRRNLTKTLCKNRAKNIISVQKKFINFANYLQYRHNIL